MRRTVGICSVLTCLITAPAGAAPPTRDFAAMTPAQQETRAAEVLRVSKDNVFALGGVGDGGTRPTKLLAYQAILRRGDAPAVFHKLLSVRSPVTQLYALTGLSKCAPQTFRRIAPGYVSRRDRVPMMSGCIAFDRPFGDAVRDLAAGRRPDSFGS